MTLSSPRRIIGVSRAHQATQQALDELEASGFSMEQVSLIVLDRDWQEPTNETKQPSGHHTYEGIATPIEPKTWIRQGSLIGLSSIFIPDVGFLSLAGAAGVKLATHLAAKASYTQHKLLDGLDLPEQATEIYNAHVLLGHYLVVVDGSVEEIQQAASILSHWNFEDLHVYDLPLATDSL